MAILKTLWKNDSGLYEAIIDLGDKEIFMKQYFKEGGFKIEEFEPVYDTLSETVNEEGDN